MQQVMTHSTAEPTVQTKMLLQHWLSNMEPVSRNMQHAGSATPVYITDCGRGSKYHHNPSTFEGPAT